MNSKTTLPNAQAEPRDPETPINPEFQGQTKDKTRVGSSGLLGGPFTLREEIVSVANETLTFLTSSTNFLNSLIEHPNLSFRE